MQARRIQAFGPQVIYEPTGDVEEGQVVVLNGGADNGALVGVATRYISQGTYGSLETGGLFDFLLAYGTTVSAGSDVYWMPNGDPLESLGAAGSGAAGPILEGEHYYLGKAVANAESLSEVVRVLLAPARLPGLMPRSGAATNVNGHWGMNAGASGTTASLDDPLVIGQELLIYLAATLGGYIDVVAAHAIDQASHTTMRFDTAGESARLVAIGVGADIRWRVAHSEGVSFS